MQHASKEKNHPKPGLSSHKLKTSLTWARRGRQEMAPQDQNYKGCKMGFGSRALSLLSNLAQASSNHKSAWVRAAKISGSHN